MNLRRSLIQLLTLLLLFFLASIGCQARPSVIRPALEGQGELVVYLEPLPQEADNLTFSLEEVSAVREDGQAFPLNLSLTDLKGLEIKRQRLFASGILPPGKYSGLSITIRSAILRGEEGETALLLPEAPALVDSTFEIRKKRSLLLSMVFTYAGSVRPGYSFSPVFSLYQPARPVIGLIGYVGNYGSNSITVFDKERGEAVAVIATGRGPRGLALDQQARRAYVALSEDDSVEVIDVTAGEIIHRIGLYSGDTPQEPALTPDGKTLLTANKGSNTVSVIDTSALIEVQRLRVGDGPCSIAVDPAGKRAYVFNTFASTISVIDLANRFIAATLSTDPEPIRGAFDRKGERLYVIYKGSSYVDVIDPGSLSVLDRFYVGMGSSALKVDTRSDFLYLTRKQESEIEIYDPLSFFPVESIGAGRGITYMTIDNDNNDLYAVLPAQKALMIFNLISKKVSAKIDVGEEPYWVTLMGER